ncbi:MAG: hypothetical protein Q7S10_02060 [bacterium]|nr:hypothetical protein [bacterium]
MNPEREIFREPEINAKEGELRNPNLEKEGQWKVLEEKFKKETDRLGYEIEPGIFDVVVALNALGINTRQSCEGHVDRGRTAPWVDVQYPNQPRRFTQEERIEKEVAKESNLSLNEVENAQGDKGYEAWQEVQRRVATVPEETSEYIEWMKENERLLKKVKGILGEFYQERQVSENVKLTLSDMGPSDFTLYNGGKDYSLIFKERKISKQQKEKLTRRLEEYRKEFQEFAQFLKEKFFK